MQSALLATLFLTSTLLAQSVVVPNAYATTLGTSQLNSLVQSSGNARTYQYGVNASELTAIPVGAVITGIGLRFMVLASNPPTWPAADTTWTDYQIFAGPAIPTANWQADPSMNFAAPPQQVRSGPMTLDMDSFLSPNVPGTPNPWSEFYFDFQQPYVYTGGDIALLFSHPGSTSTAAAKFPEVVTSNATTHGVARFEAVYPAGTGTFPATFYVMRIHYGFGAGCPSSTGAVPVLVQSGDVAGGSVTLQIANSLPGSIVVFALGFSQVQVPLGSGCDLLVSPAVLLAQLAGPTGRAFLSLTFPPGVVGSFFTQGALLDPLLPLGFCVTNGV